MTEPTINIPDFLPHLRGGKGNGPKDGGCLVQLASWIGRGKWTDGERSGVIAILRECAIVTNDNLDNVQRQRLLPFVARLAGTTNLFRTLTPRDQQALSGRLRILADHLMSEIMTTRNRIIAEGGSADLMEVGSPASQAVSDLWVARLTKLCDEFDRAVGRDPNSIPQPTPQVWAELREVMGIVDPEGRETCDQVKQLMENA